MGETNKKEVTVLVYSVLLQSRGNPDFGEDPNDELSPELVVRVDTFASASLRCIEYITVWKLGSGNWTGGRVTDENGNVIAHVSYNGRVWTPDPWPRSKLLYGSF